VAGHLWCLQNSLVPTPGGHQLGGFGGLAIQATPVTLAPYIKLSNIESREYRARYYSLKNKSRFSIFYITRNLIII
jgi:hypothetical protein